MLPIKKIYIDTRWKTSSSKSDTDFSVQLPQNYYMPRNTVFYIDDVSIPVSWYSIQNNRNNKFYCQWANSIKVLELPEGDYDAIKLAKALSASICILFGVDGQTQVFLISVSPLFSSVTAMFPCSLFDCK